MSQKEKTKQKRENLLSALEGHQMGVAKLIDRVREYPDALEFRRKLKFQKRVLSQTVAKLPYGKSELARLSRKVNL